MTIIKSQLFGFPVNMDEADITYAKVRQGGNLVDLIDLIGDPQTDALAGLTPTADSLPYFTSETTATTTPITAFARSILDDANEAAFKATVNLETGVDVQAYSANLTSWAGLATSAKQDASANLDAWSALATSAKANTSHTHSAADITSGTLDAARLPTNAVLSSGSILQVVTTKYTTESSGTTTIPADDTIPQNTEGTEFFTLSITPKESASTILVMAQGEWGHSNSAGTASVALFKDSEASAFTSIVVDSDGVNNARDNIMLIGTFTAGGTSAVTIKMRAGPTSGTFYINWGGSGSSLHSTANGWTMTAFEIKA